MDYINFTCRFIMAFLRTCNNCKSIYVRCFCQWSQIILKKHDFSCYEQTDSFDDDNEITNNYLFNEEYFWLNLKNTQIARNSIALYNIRTITLGTDQQTNLHLGINPFTRFSIRCQFECKNTGKSVACDIDGLKNIFEFVHRFFNVDICHPKTMYSTSMQDVDLNAKVSLEVARFYHRLFTLTIDSSSLKIAENSLDQLIQKESMIHQILFQLQEERNELKKNFFDLLHVYFEHHRNKYLIHIYNPVNVQQFFDETIGNVCACAPKNFIITTAIYFKDWFVNIGLPTYVKTLLLSEKNRLKTFMNGNWPHKYIDTTIMAKTGLFFLAPIDRVQCIFCEVQIEKWTEEDDPLKDHYKYSRHCPLLNEMPTQNNSIDEKYLHQCLRTIANEKIHRGYDEVDKK